MNSEQVGDDIELNDFTLTYSITKSESVFEGKEYHTYGIEIVKKSLSQVERAKIEDVTTDKIRIEEIVNTMKKNTVTPIHLYDVMETFL